MMSFFMVNAFNDCSILGVEISKLYEEVFKSHLESFDFNSIGAGIRNLETIDFLLSIKRIRQTTSDFTTIFAISLTSDETTVVV